MGEYLRMRRILNYDTDNNMGSDFLLAHPMDLGELVRRKQLSDSILGVPASDAQVRILQAGPPGPVPSGPSLRPRGVSPSKAPGTPKSDH